MCMDIDGGKLLDFLEKRDVITLSAYFEKADNHGNVEVFCQDMWPGYKAIAKRWLKRATIVIDRFHVVRYANEAMDAAASRSRPRCSTKTAASSSGRTAYSWRAGRTWPGRRRIDWRRLSRTSFSGDA